MPLDHSKCQGNLIKSFRGTHKHAAFLFLQFKDPRRAVDAARQGLTRGDQDLHLDLPARILGLSLNGYRKLGIAPPSELRSMGDPSYRASWTRNRDSWEPLFTKEIDAALLISHGSEVGLAQAVTFATNALNEFATVTEVRHQRNAQLEPPRHPDFKGKELGTLRNPESILNPVHFDVLDPADHGVYATFLKIKVESGKVAAALQEMRDKGIATDDDHAKSLILGRQPDGRPPGNVKHPGGSDDAYTLHGATPSECPFHAHAAVMNPRGRSAKTGQTQAPNQIVRRSWTYSEGMLFFSYQKDPLDFAVLMNRAQNFRDPLLAIGTDVGGRVWQAHEDEHEHGQKWAKAGGGTQDLKIADLTTIRGGEHFYFPSIDFLNGL